MSTVCAEHRHSLRPSTLLSIYLSITVLFDIARARSYFRRPGMATHGGLLTGIAFFKASLAILEEVSKRSLFKSQRGRSSLGPECTSGFWTRSLFLWLNSTLFLGFRRILSADDLDDIGPKFSSARLLKKFELYWAASKPFANEN